MADETTDPIEPLETELAAAERAFENAQGDDQRSHLFDELDHWEAEREFLHRSGARSAELARRWLDGEPQRWSVEQLEISAEQVNALRVLASNAEDKADQLEAAAATAQHDLGPQAEIDARPAGRSMRRWAAVVGELAEDLKRQRPVLSAPRR